MKTWSPAERTLTAPRDETDRTKNSYRNNKKSKPKPLPWVPPGRDPNNIVFIKADSDAIYPFKMPYEADSNAIYAI